MHWLAVEQLCLELLCFSELGLSLSLPALLSGLLESRNEAALPAELGEDK